MTSPASFKRDIVDELFRRSDQLSCAAGSEILRLRQAMQTVWGIYYSNDFANDDARMWAMLQVMNETLKHNPNYPNFY
jgi:predicted metallopeptidase